MDIKVSIVIPAYNLENYIGRCLNSLINQTFKEFEIIIINDGSTDNTKKIVESYSLKDKRIKLINKNNEGVNIARKVGFENAKGEYVLFIDGDDWIKKECLEILYYSAIKDNCDLLIYNAITKSDLNEQNFRMFTLNINESDCITLVLTNNILPSVWSKLIKRKFLIDNSIDIPKNIAYGEDLAFLVNIAIKHPKINFVDEYLYYYYQRNNSVSNARSEKVLDLIESCEYIKDKLRHEDILEKYIQEYNFLCFYHIFIRKIVKSEIQGEYEKTLYKYFKKCAISFNNEYIIDYINKCDKLFRIKIYIFKTSYLIGKLAYNIKHLLRSGGAYDNN